MTTLEPKPSRIRRQRVWRSRFLSLTAVLGLCAASYGIVVLLR